MAAERPATIQEVVAQLGAALAPLEPMEDSLLSLEKLDRASPDLWPEQMPGLGQWTRLQPPATTTGPPRQPAWTEPLTPDDNHLLQQLSCLSTGSIIFEVKKLHDLAYKLGVDEAKEMTRGKYLNIFKSRRQR